MKIPPFHPRTGVVLDVVGAFSAGFLAGRIGGWTSLLFLVAAAAFALGAIAATSSAYHAGKADLMRAAETELSERRRKAAEN